MTAARMYIAATLLAASVAGCADNPFDRLHADQVAHSTLHQRSVQAVIWGMPAVNYDLMLQAAIRDAKAAPAGNQIIYWSRPSTWRNQTLTPNPDTIYFMPFINTKDVGPVVLEIPPALPNGQGTIVGSIDDAWQCTLEDVGPAGVDKGKGGKYLILPPGYTDKIPDGYIPLPSNTYQNFALLRSNLQNGGQAAISQAVEYGKRVKLYPLSKAANALPTTFIDAIDVVFDATIPYDLRYFQSLDRIIQREPWLTRDKAMIDTLKSLGIEKGHPFTPNPHTRKMLTHAAADAHTWLSNQYENAYFPPPYFKDSRWAVPASPAVIEGMTTLFANPDSYPIDGRAVTYSFAFFSAKHLGEGQFYLMTLKDKQANTFHGNNFYRLTVPPNAPVSQYWSATAYDRATHALIRGMPWASRSSQSPGIEKNPDGSVTLYFGPLPPDGKDANWVPTDPAGGGTFEVLFRFYGPDKSLFDKSWTLPDIEKVH